MENFFRFLEYSRIWLWMLGNFNLKKGEICKEWMHSYVDIVKIHKKEIKIKYSTDVEN